MGSKIFLAHECGHPGLSVQRSEFSHEKIDIGVFACTNFEKKNMVGSYYESMAYEDLRKELQVAKRYGKEYMEFTADGSWR